MKKFFYLPLLILALCTSCCCKSIPKKTLKEEKPLVLVTIAPYRHLTKAIVKEEIDVETITPSGANPHSYEPTIRQVATLGKAVVWFQIGELFEAKISPLMKQRNHQLTLVNLLEGIDLLPLEEENHCEHCCHHHNLDRHLWLSPKLALTQSRFIYETLCKKFPEKEAIFTQNFGELEKKLTQLDHHLEQQLKPLQGSLLLVSHPAFGYFCHDYQMEQLSVEQEGKDPRPRYLEKILDKTCSTHTSSAISIPQYNNKGVELIAHKLKISLHSIDPYQENCLETMKNLADLLIPLPDSSSPNTSHSSLKEIEKL